MDSANYGMLSIRKVLKEEGVRGLYRGKWAGANTLLPINPDRKFTTTVLRE